jgi:hypothetical protein
MAFEVLLTSEERQEIGFDGFLEDVVAFATERGPSSGLSVDIGADTPITLFQGLAYLREQQWAHADAHGGMLRAATSKLRCMASLMASLFVARSGGPDSLRLPTRIFRLVWLLAMVPTRFSRFTPSLSVESLRPHIPRRNKPLKIYLKKLYLIQDLRAVVFVSTLLAIW